MLVNFYVKFNRFSLKYANLKDSKGSPLSLLKMKFPHTDLKDYLPLLRNIVICVICSMLSDFCYLLSVI